MNWYYCNDGTTVNGPLPREELEALYHCGTIDDETPIVAEGSTDWMTFREIVKESSNVQDDAPYINQSRPDRRIETIPASVARVAGRIDFGDILKWVGSHKKSVGIAIVSLLLLPALSSKVRSKIERERAGREFRERVMSQRANDRSSSQISFKQKANRAAYDAYMQGYRDPQQGEVARLLSERASGEELKVYALIVQGTEDRKNGLAVRYEVDE